jgi:hypothetical protein
VWFTHASVAEKAIGALDRRSKKSFFDTITSPNLKAAGSPQTKKKKDHSQSAFD